MLLDSKKSPENDGFAHFPKFLSAYCKWILQWNPQDAGKEPFHLTFHVKSKNWVKTFFSTHWYINPPGKCLRCSGQAIPAHLPSKIGKIWKVIASHMQKEKKTKIGVKTCFSSNYIGEPQRCCGRTIPA